MADSCRPVSRHGGRYSSKSNQLDVQYSDNLPSYPTVDYNQSQDRYSTNSNQSSNMMETFERPKTGRGYRRVRPPSRGGREEVFDESKTGRPSSRVGFRPDTYERHDYDEFSRQDRLKGDQSDSDDSSPRGGNNSPVGYPSSDRYSPHGITVSPQEEYLSANSPSALRLLNRETMPQNSPYGSPQQYKSPVSSPHHRETGSPYYSHRPGRRIKIPDQSQDEQQVFDFEVDERYEQPRSYSGHEQFVHQGPYPSDELNNQPQFQNTRPYSGSHQYQDVRPQSGKRKHQNTEYYSGNDAQYYQPNERQNSGDIYPDPSQSGYAPILSGKDRYKYDHYQHPEQVVDSTSTSEVFTVHEERPSSSKSRPRSSRPKSARKRPQSARKKRQEEQYQQDETYTQTSDPSTMVRPHSSFLRYKPLPAIGSNEPVSNLNQAEELAEQTKHLHLQETQRTRRDSVNLAQNSPFTSETIQSDQNSTSETEKQNALGADQEERTEFRLHKLPTEPVEGEERLLLAIRLPDGKRVQRYFRVAEKMEVVKQYAENALCSDLSQYSLSCKSPKALFTDLTQLVGEVGLADRTLLFLVQNS